MPFNDFLPISMLNQLEYCERRFYLMHVQGEMEVNAHVAEGTWRHEQAHSGQAERSGETVVHRRVYVWSDDLCLSGFCDVIEETAGRLTPIEYKKGRMGEWLNDHIQLCAQAVCLEERGGTNIPLGYIFYFGSRRREQVLFTSELRTRTAQAVERAQQLIGALCLPQPIDHLAKCRDCSLEPICLPAETRLLAGIDSTMHCRTKSGEK